MSFGSPQIPHDLTRAVNVTAAMGSWRLTTCTASVQQNQTSSAQLGACWHLAGFLLGLLCVPEDDGDVFLGYTGLHYVVSHGTKVFITTAMRISNPAEGINLLANIACNISAV
jgi:hypothetical protein